MNDILERLSGGDRRSIGRVNEVVAAVLADPALFDGVFQGMLNDDPIVRMRAADAVEKITRQHPDWLEPYKTVLIEQIAASEQQEVRWHLAQMLPRLVLDEEERRRATEILFGYLDDRSKIVQTNALQALADLAGQDDRLLPQVIAVIESRSKTGSAAVRNRGRKLLEQLRAG